VLSLLTSATDPSETLSSEAQNAIVTAYSDAGLSSPPISSEGADSSAKQANREEDSDQLIAATDENTSAEKAVLLFVREEGCPYACLGRLAVSEVNLAVKPIRITWRLVDYDSSALKTSVNFKNLVRMNSSLL
jgi:hypothetical protein